VYGRFRFPRVPFGEMTVEGEGRFLSGRKEKKEQDFFASLQKNGGEFGGGDNDGGLEIGFMARIWRFVDDELHRNQAS